MPKLDTSPESVPVGSIWRANFVDADSERGRVRVTGNDPAESDILAVWCHNEEPFVMLRSAWRRRFRPIARSEWPSQQEKPKPEIEVGSVWRHRMTGNIARVIGFTPALSSVFIKFEASGNGATINRNFFARVYEMVAGTVDTTPPPEPIPKTYEASVSYDYAAARTAMQQRIVDDIARMERAFVGQQPEPSLRREYETVQWLEDRVGRQPRRAAAEPSREERQSRGPEVLPAPGRRKFREEE